MFLHQAQVHCQQSGAMQRNTSSLWPALQTEDEQLARAIAASMGQEVPPVPSSRSQAGPGQGQPQQWQQQQWGSAGGVPNEGRRAAGPPSTSGQQPGAQKGGGCSC